MTDTRKRDIELEQAGPEARMGFEVLQALTSEQRLAVLCWFCAHCGREEEVGGLSCRCWDDS